MRSEPMMDALKDQCAGVWRLGAQGRWRCIWRDEGAQVEQMEGVVELFASMCGDQLEPGAEITAKMGDWMLMAQVDEQGVLIGVKNRLGNPLTIRTAMNLIESRSQRDVSSPARPSGLEEPTAPNPEAQSQLAASPLASRAFEDFPALDSSADIAAIAQAAGKSSTANGQLADPYQSEQLGALEAGEQILSMDDLLGGHEHAAGPRTAEEIPTGPMRARSSPPPQTEGLGQEDSEGFAFEIVFNEDEPDAPAVSAEVSRVPSQSLRACTWGDISAHIVLLVEQMSAEIGRRVATNYWRAPIESHEALRDWIHVDAARSRIRPIQPEAPLEPGQREAMRGAFEQWVSRCELVVPEARQIAGQLPLAPWTLAP